MFPDLAESISANPPLLAASYLPAAKLLDLPGAGAVGPRTEPGSRMGRHRLIQHKAVGELTSSSAADEGDAGDIIQIGSRNAGSSWRCAYAPLLVRPFNRPPATWRVPIYHPELPRCSVSPGRSGLIAFSPTTAPTKPLSGTDTPTACWSRVVQAKP